MKQNYNQEIHERFKKHFYINDIPGKWDVNYLFKTQKYLRYVKWIPGIKMIGVGNSTSMNAGKESSDIDLYIVTDRNRMWLVRILVTAIFQVMGVRKTAKNHDGRFCLSFFSTTSLLDFSSFALDIDIYLYFWIVYFKPILDFDDTYDTFIKVNNSWADFSDYKELIGDNKDFICYKKQTKKQNFISKFMFDKIDSIFKSIFLPKTKKSFKNLGNPFGIIINDDMLKFHDNDIREKIKSTFS